MPIVKPPTTFIPALDFGIPKLTAGRGAQQIRAILLHDLEMALEEYDAQIVGDSERRDKAHHVHASMHYAVDYAGNVHQYVADANIAWGTDDHRERAFPTAPAPGIPAWTVQTAQVGSPVDSYVINIATVSGILGGQILTTPTNIPFTDDMQRALIQLIAFLCDTYSIPVDSEHIVTHNRADADFVNRCVNPNYPLADIITGVQTYIAADGEPDVFVPLFMQTPITPVDTDSVNLTVSGDADHTLTADVKLSADVGNIIQERADGLYAAAAGGLAVTDTPSVDLTINAGILDADVKISADAGNGLEEHADGLYTAENVTLDVLDTATLDLSLQTGPGPVNILHGDVKISADVGNIIEARADGLYAASLYPVPAFRAEISQIDEDAPVGNTLFSTIGDPTYARTDAGVYTLTWDDPLPFSKDMFYVTNANLNIVAVYRTLPDTITIETAGDDVLDCTFGIDGFVLPY